VKITNAPSPNFDERTLPVTMLVLHYTGMESAAAALERMRDLDAKVSAHYMIDEDGGVTRLVDEDMRAWHAGVSFWDGITNINSASIGIEIVNGGHDFGLPEFPGKQIDAVIELSNEIIKKFEIPVFNIVGHSDIAPARKQDPGEKFPWKLLAENQIGIWPDNIGSDTRLLFDAGDKDRGISIVQRGLSFIGYNIEVNGELDQQTAHMISAVQRRYRPQKIDGLIDVQTLELVTSLAGLKSGLSGSATV
jgi:N-acetylmuramoyl-L-alanine amidase